LGETRVSKAKIYMEQTVRGRRQKKLLPPVKKKTELKLVRSRRGLMSPQGGQG